MSNLTCSEFGPSLPVTDPFKTAQFAFLLGCSFFMFITTGLVLYVRGYRRRLRVRSLLPYYVGSFGSANYIILRAAFDYVGREYFPCYLNVWVFYMYIPCMVLADILSAALFVSKQFKRQHLNANTLHAIAKIQHDNPDSALVGREKIDEWFRGLWNYGISIAEVSSFFGRFDEKLWYHSNVNVSSFREATYECFGVFLISLPFIFTAAIRGSGTWQYDLNNGCSGCIVIWIDVLLNFLYLTIIGIITLAVSLRVKKYKLPDPLRYMEDLKYSGLMGFPLVTAGYILLIVDPGSLMKQQMIDWHIFELIVMVILHCMRTVVQLYRTSRSHRINKQNIKLLDILTDTNGKGALLFEKHLIAENAKVLWRTFISSQAQLPINISANIKRDLDARFKGVVGRSIFDVALLEVYLMMQNGAFQRFIQSQSFASYAKSRADFSLSIASSSLQVAPAIEDENGREGAQTIKDYIRSL